MGINFAAVCHPCKKMRWMFRGKESEGIHSFFREHKEHLVSDAFGIVSDQSDYYDRLKVHYREEFFPFDPDLPEEPPRGEA